MTISQKQFQFLIDWFHDYVRKYYSNIVDIDNNVRTKEIHTECVREISKDIGLSIKLSEDHLKLAETIALFHDLGRFEQYTQYQTFDDNKSLNHAELGINILKKNKLLKGFAPSSRGIIYTAILHHNKPQIPRDLGGLALLMTRLIRDADKIDIYRVVLEGYEELKSKSNEPVIWGLLNTSEITPEIIDDFLLDRIILSSKMRTMSDLKIFQLAWIYDLNFDRTLQIIKERQYLEQILEFIPDSKQKSIITDKIIKHVGKLNGSNAN